MDWSLDTFHFAVTLPSQPHANCATTPWWTWRTTGTTAQHRLETFRSRSPGGPGLVETSRLARLARLVGLVQRSLEWQFEMFGKL